MTNKKGEKVSVVKVSEAFQQDVGYGRARIDNQTCSDLELSIGEIVEIKGNETTPAVVFRAHPTDEGKGIIRVDNLTRKNLDVELGEKVTIKKATPKEAEKVILTPILSKDQQIEFGWGIEKLIQKELRNRPLSKNDTLIVPGVTIYGSSLPFKVVDTLPEKIVFIHENTVIKITSECIQEELVEDTSKDDGKKAIKKEKEIEPYTMFKISEKGAKEIERKLEHVLIDSIYDKEDYVEFCKKAFPSLSKQEIYKIIYFTYYC